MLEYDNDPCNGCNYPLCAVCPYRDTDNDTGSDKQSNEPKKYNNEQTKKKKRKRK